LDERFDAPILLIEYGADAPLLDLNLEVVHLVMVNFAIRVNKSLDLVLRARFRPRVTLINVKSLSNGELAPPVYFCIESLN